ncbi:MAG: hypothetical protein Q9206_001552 [Seirophora lacunosa]
MAAVPSPGEAIFSTGLGRYPPRAPGVLPGRIILRSVPEDDMEAMIDSLQAKYPAQCSAINSAVTDLVSLSKYFDDYDQQLHGARFLQVVLTQISQRNEIRRTMISDYIQQWISLNQAAFRFIDNYGLNAFTDDDVEVYGKEFLMDVLAELQLRRAGHVQDCQYSVHFPPGVARLQDCSCILERRRFSAKSSGQQYTVSYLPLARPTALSKFSAKYIGSCQFNTINTFRYTRDTSSELASLAGAVSTVPHGRRRFKTATRPTEASSSPDTVTLTSLSPFRLKGWLAGQLLTIAFQMDVVCLSPQRTPSETLQDQEDQSTLAHRTMLGYLRKKMSLDIDTHSEKGVWAGKTHIRLANKNPSQNHSLLFSKAGSENMSVELIDSAKRAMSSDNGYVAAAYAQGSYRKHQNMSIRAPLDRMSAPYEDGRANPAQHFTTPPRRGRDTFPGSSDAERHGYPGNIPSHHVHNTFDALPLYSPTRHRYSNASSRPPRVNPRAENSEEQHTSASSHTHRWDRNEAFCDRKVWIGGLKPDANSKVLADLLQQWGPFNVSKIKVSKLMHERETHFNGYAFADFAFPQNAADAIQALHGRHVEAYGYRLYMKPAYDRPPNDDRAGSPRKPNSRMNDRSGHQGLMEGNVEESKLAGARASSAGYQHQESNPVPLDQPALASNKREQVSAEPPEPGSTFLDPIPGSQASNNLQSSIKVTEPEPSLVSTPETSSEIHGEGNPRGQLTATKIPSPVKSKVHKDAGRSSTPKTPSPKETKPDHVDKDEPTNGQEAQVKQRKDMLSNPRTEKLALDQHDPASTTDDRQQVQDPTNQPLMPEEPQEPKVAVHQVQSPIQTSPAYATPAHVRHLSSPSVLMPTAPTSYAQSECSESGSKDLRTSPTRKKDSPPVAAMRSAQTASSEPVDVSRLDKLLAKAADTDLQASAGDHVPIASGQRHNRYDNIRSSSVTALRDPSLAATEIQQPQLESADIQLDPKGDIRLQMAEPVHRTLPEHEEYSAPQQKSSSIHGSLNATSQPSPEDPPSLQSKKASAPSPKRGLSKDPKLLTAIPKGLPPVRRKPHAQSTNMKRGEPSKEPSASVELRETPKQTEDTTSLADDALQDLSSLGPNLALTAVGEETPVPPTIQEDKEDPELATSADPAVADTEDAEAQVEDIPRVCQVVSASDSVVPPEDNQLHPDTGMPQEMAADMEDQEEAASVLQETKQPAVGQKKRKNKKGKKKSKKAKSSQTIPTDTNNKNPVESISAERPAKAVMAPIVERPFISDDGHDLRVASNVERPFVSDEGQDLRRPLFVQQNHSSMSRRIDNNRNNAFVKGHHSSMEEGLDDDFGDHKSYTLLAYTNDGAVKPVRILNPTQESTVKDGVGELTGLRRHDATSVFSNHQAGSPLEPLLNVDEATRQARVKEIDNWCLKNDKASRGDLLDMLTIIAPPRPTGSGVLDNADWQAKSSQRPKNSGLYCDPGNLVHKTTQIDEHSQKNNEASGDKNSDTLSATVPEPTKEEGAPQAPYEQTEESYQGMDEAKRRANDKPAVRTDTSEILSTIVPESSLETAPSQDDGEPKGEYYQNKNEAPRHSFSNTFSAPGPDISHDDNRVYDNDQAQSPPTAPLKERAQRMLPSRDPSPDPASGEDAAKATASFPSTRRISPERGRDNLHSSATGLGLSSIGQSSANRENVSPSRLQPNASLSYRQVAIASGTHAIQPGDIVELVPNDSDSGGKKVPGLTLQKAGNDPWRVPSAEQYWGANKSTKGKGPTETPEAQK